MWHIMKIYICSIADKTSMFKCSNGVWNFFFFVSVFLQCFRNFLIQQYWRTTYVKKAVLNFFDELRSSIWGPFFWNQFKKKLNGKSMKIMIDPFEMRHITCSLEFIHTKISGWRFVKPDEMSFLFVLKF